MVGDKKYILDASALYPLVVELREKLLDYTDIFAVLGLTLYEVGDIFGKSLGKER